MLQCHNNIIMDPINRAGEIWVWVEQYIPIFPYKIT